MDILHLPYAETIGDIDAARINLWLHNLYEWYSSVQSSTWGFPVVLFVAFIACFLLFTKTSTSIIAGLNGLAKRFRAFKGRRQMRKKEKLAMEQWLADGFTDYVEEGVANRKLTRKQAQGYYERLGKALKISDLIPKVPQKKRMLALKSRLKQKFGGKVVELAAKRKELTGKTLTMRQRLDQARKTG